MTEQSRRCTRQKQDKTIEKKLARGPKNRGAYLPGLWSCRMAAGLTQRELARLAGSHQSTICDLENLNRGGYPATIKRLCKALAVAPVDLLCGELSEDLK